MMAGSSHCSGSGGRQLLNSWLFGMGLLTAGGAIGGNITEPLNFEDVTNTRIVQNVSEVTNNEKSVDTGDFDRDGDMDVVIGVALADFGGRRNKLYRNDNGVFIEVSGGSIIPGFNGSDVTRVAYFRDFDSDGWVDIYLVNDSNSDNDKYFRNNHPGGVFDSFIDESNLRLPVAGDLGASCSGVAEDFNGNGSIDIYAGNYPFDSQDRMIFNDGDGMFTQVTNTHVPADSDYTVHIAAGDMNGDTKLDLLIGNEHDPQFIYYNDNQGAGSAEGDFSYTGSVQQIGPDQNGEVVLQPIDMDGDGDLDIYWSNAPGGGDRFLRNDGNDAGNQAILTSVDVLPSSVKSRATRKVTVADLNSDRRDDLIVMFETASNSRPVILRNVSTVDDVAFLDWTPGDAFPDGSLHKGWRAISFDVNSDLRPDIFLGGYNDDHFFDNVASNEVLDTDIGNVLPALYNADPVVVDGTLEEPGTGFLIPYRLEVLARGPQTLSTEEQLINAVTGDTSVKSFSLAGVANGGIVSAIAQSCGDVSLSILDSGMALLAEVDRGGAEVEEPVQIDAPGGDLIIEVALLDAGDCGDRVFNNGFE